jgi:UDP-N-acetylglucosamine 2-epimerase (non-hydrolysing)
VTITEGTNRLVKISTEDIVKNYRQIKQAGGDVGGRVPKFWDGRAAERIAKIIAEAQI